MDPRSQTRTSRSARDAGNMVDLDSNPIELIEIVGFGKQLLMADGAHHLLCRLRRRRLFAIIPAMFVVLHPGLDGCNVMALAAPPSAILDGAGSLLARPSTASSGRSSVSRSSTSWSAAHASRRTSTGQKFPSPARRAAMTSEFWLIEDLRVIWGIVPVLLSSRRRIDVFSHLEVIPPARRNWALRSSENFDLPQPKVDVSRQPSGLRR